VNAAAVHPAAIILIIITTGCAALNNVTAIPEQSLVR